MELRLESLLTVRMCVAVEAAHCADDLLHPVPGAAMVCGIPKLCQPPVYLDGYHAHAGESFVCLHFGRTQAHSLVVRWLEVACLYNWVQLYIARCAHRIASAHGQPGCACDSGADCSAAAM